MADVPERRVFVVDDHPVVRQGICQIFEREADFTVCGEAEAVTEAFSLIPAAGADLVVSDLSLEGRSGLELAKHLSTYHPDVPVLILSMHDEALYAQRALAMGARGYIMKRQPPTEILFAAREVLAGRLYVPASISETVTAGTEEGFSTEGSPLDILTDRELEVFMLIGQGFAPRHIAEQPECEHHRGVPRAPQKQAHSRQFAHAAPLRRALVQRP